MDYAVAGRWYLRRSDAVLLSGVTAAVAQAVEDWRLWQRSQPGRDINPTRLIAAVQAAGAKRVELDSPAFRALEATQVARETDISLLFGGLEDELSLIHILQGTFRLENGDIIVEGVSFLHHVHDCPHGGQTGEPR